MLCSHKLGATRLLGHVAVHSCGELPGDVSLASKVWRPQIRWVRMTNKRWRVTSVLPPAIAKAMSFGPLTLLPTPTPRKQAQQRGMAWGPHKSLC